MPTEPTVSVTSGHGRIAGTITDQAGQPIKGVCVEAVSRRSGGAAISTKTGSYRTGKLAPGRYIVVFFAGCGSKGNWVGQIYKNSENPAKHAFVKVTAGHTATGVDARLKPGGEISGVVTGQAGKKLSNICVAPVSVSHKPVYNFASIGLSNRGTYHVPNLPPGRYQVLFSPCTQTSRYLQVWWPNSTTESGAKLVTVRASHPVSGIDQALPVGGKISGIVTDSSSTPLSGICVFANGGKSTGFASFATQTGTDGSYTVEGLPTGTYQIVLQTGCGNNGNYVTTSTPANIAVTEGQTAAGVDVVMQAGAVLSGSVTDTADQPLQGICVNIVEQNFGFVASPHTNAAGTYSVSQIPPGTYTVQFTGGCGNKGSYAPQAWDNTNVTTATPITIKVAETIGDINAVMQTGATLAGHIANTAGKKLSGVCIAAGSPALMRETAGQLFDDVAVSSRGSYRLANLLPGQYDVLFANGCGASNTDYALQWFRSRPDSVGASAVWAAAGATTSGVSATLLPGGALSGLTHNAAGHGLSAFCVQATNLATGSQRPMFGISFVGGTLSAYSLSELTPGPYRVVFGGSCAGGNYATQWYRRSATERGATRVIVRASHTTKGINSALVRGGTISGHVTAAGTSTQLKNVCVFAQDVSQPAFFGFSQTNKQGFYRVVGLNTGRYELSFAPCTSGGAGNAADLLLPRLIQVRTGHPTGGVDAALSPGGTIAGSVTGGSPTASQPDVCVTANGGSVAASDEVSTGADGSFQMQNLPPGNYHVSFAAQPDCDEAGLFAPQNYSGPVSVSAGATTSGIDVTLGNDGTISGTVTSAAGQKLTGVCVTAFGPSGPVVATTSAGGYTIGSLVPGRYLVQFSAGCGASGLRPQWWRHAASRSKAKAIQITAGASITGINASLRG
jgi:hypothetical protein